MSNIICSSYYELVSVLYFYNVDLTFELCVILPNYVCPGYDFKLSDGESPALEIWIMWSTSSLALFPGPL